MSEASNSVPLTERLFEQSHVRKPEYWQFIRLVAPDVKPPLGQTSWTSHDAKEAYCLKCERAFSFAIGNSAHVRRHMERFHSQELGKFLKQKKRKSNNSTRLDESLKKIKKEIEGSSIQLDSKHEELIQLALVEWLVCSYLPLNLVEDHLFQQFIGRLISIPSFPKFQIPTIGVLQEQIENMKIRVSNQLISTARKEMLDFSLSVEIWNTKAEKQVFQTLMLHYMTYTFEMKSFTVSVDPKRDGYNLNNTIDREINRLDTDKSNMTVIIMESKPMHNSHSVNSPGELRFTCISHYIQSIFSEYFGHESLDINSEEIALESKEHISCIFKQARELVKYLQNPSDLREFIFEESQGHCSSIKLDFSRKWQSTIEMINCLISMRPYLDAFEPRLEKFENHVIQLSKEQWFTLSAFIEATKPFIHFSNLLLSESYSSLPLTLPCVLKLLSDLDRNDSISTIGKQYGISKNQQCYRYLEDAIKSIHSAISIQYSDFAWEYIWISALDPRCIKFSQFPKEVLENAKATLVHHASSIEILKSSKVFKKSTSGLGIDEDDISNPYMMDIMGGWGESSEKSTVEDVYTSADEQSQSIVQASSEVNKYFASIKERVVDPLLWWKLHSSEFPRLSILARKWLGTMSTCRRSNGLDSSSTGNNVLSRNKSDLDINGIETMVFLHDNLSTQQFD